MQGSNSFGWQRIRAWLLLFTLVAADWTLVCSARAQVPAQPTVQAPVPGPAPTPAQAPVHAQAPVQAPAPDPISAAFERVRERARELAKADYEPPPDDLPAVLRDMQYPAYRAINYLPDAAIWAGQALLTVIVTWCVLSELKSICWVPAMFWRSIWASARLSSDEIVSARAR